MIETLSSTEPTQDQTTDPLAGTYVEIDASDLESYPKSLSTLLAGELKIILLRNMPEPLVLKDRILQVVGEIYGADFKKDAAAFLDELKVPSEEVMAAMVNVTNSLRECKFISTLFSDLVSKAGFPAPTVVDGAILRFYLPNHYSALRTRNDLFRRSDFMSDVPHDEAGHSLCSNLPVGPHRDIDVPMASLPVNMWFALQPIPKWRSLLFFPKALREKLISFPPHLSEKEPDTWGYGPPLQFDLKVGDILLFHCEQFHSTPWAGSEPRLSGELRVTSACIDDHSTYRRTFANLNNFKPRFPNIPGRSLKSADLLLSKIDWSRKKSRFRFVPPGPDDCAFSVLASCFDDLESARRSLCSYESDELYRRQSCSSSDVQQVYKELRGWLPFAEDRLLTCARLFASKDDLASAEDPLRQLIKGTESYFWALECGRYALRYGHVDTAEQAFQRALELAESSHVRPFRCYDVLPTSDECRQLLPAEAADTARALLPYCQTRRALIASLRPTVAVPTALEKKSFLASLFNRGSRPEQKPLAPVEIPPPLDAQLFQPSVRVHTLDADFHGYGLFACAAFKTYIAIPAHLGFFHPQLAINGRYPDLLQADSEQELIDLVWARTRLDWGASGSNEFKPVDRSIRCQIFLNDGDFVVAPNDLLKNRDDIAPAITRGDAIVAKTIDEARGAAKHLQLIYWPPKERESATMM